MTILFSFDAVVQPNAFGAGLISPPAASAKLNPGRPARVEGPTDADRIAWYFRDEIAAANAIIEADAEEYEFIAALHNGRFHA